MAIRNIRLEGDEILHKKSKEVDKIDERVEELVKDMIDTMHKYNGVGLAAVQVGVLKRIVVIDLILSWSIFVICEKRSKVTLKILK